MKRHFLPLLLLVLVLSSVTVSAGWYECYNFRGTIGGKPITLSIQLVNSYLDSHKKSFTVSGVYKLDTTNDPIRLTGEMDLDYKKAVLFETSAYDPVPKEKKRVRIEFDFSNTTSDGVWMDLVTNTSKPVHLERISKLRDFEPGDNAKNVEILLANSLSDVFFVGVYSMKDGDDRARMDLLKVIRKKDGAELQHFDLSKLAYTSGNIKTIIYDNVEVFNKRTRELLLWNNTGRMGGTTSITFDRKTHRFRLHPKPHIEGAA